MATVEADHSQFLISGAGSDLAGLVRLATPLVTVTDGLSVVSILTGTHGGAVDVTAVFTAVASDVGSEWEDVVEFSCSAGAGDVEIGELMEGASLRLVEAGGDYRVRVSARGRDAGAARNLDDMVDPDLDLPEPIPVEFFLIEAWPAAFSDPVVVRLTSKLSNPDDDQQQLPSALSTWDAALAASQALGRDLDRRRGARPLSGRRVIVHAQQEFPGTRHKLFNRLLSMGWMTCEGGEWFDQPWDYALGCWNPDKHPEHAFTGRFGDVRWVWLERVPPRQATFSWNWYLPPRRTAEPEYSFSEHVRLLEKDTQVHFSFTQRSDVAGDTWATVHVTHTDLPNEWAKDMTAIWQHALQSYAKTSYR